MSPTFGLKGGATGGGLAQVYPMWDIDLHFTKVTDAGVQALQVVERGAGGGDDVAAAHVRRPAEAALPVSAAPVHEAVEDFIDDILAGLAFGGVRLLEGTARDLLATLSVVAGRGVGEHGEAQVGRRQLAAQHLADEARVRLDANTYSVPADNPVLNRPLTT